MSKLEFCEKFLRLGGQPISFAGRCYLPAIYAAGHRNLVLRASRQVEKTTFLVNSILFEAVQRPGICMLLVCPRDEQAKLFSRDRLAPAIRASPLIRRHLLGQRPSRLPVHNLEFINGSRLYVRAAFHSADSVRGLSVDLLMVDEVQDIAAGDLPVLQETMSHSADGRTYLTGTPKLLDNHLEAMFSASTACEWTITCQECGQDVILNDRCLGRNSIACPRCHAALVAATGRWLARNPHASWGDGYWLNHCMVPWLNYQEVLSRFETYSLPKFKNEVLGLPTTLGEHIVTREELEACCSAAPMARSSDDLSPDSQPFCVAGIDWGGGAISRTAVVVGFMRADHKFEVCRFDRFRANEDTTNLVKSVADILRAFNVRAIAADGRGSGLHLNSLLCRHLLTLNSLYGIVYSETFQEPRAVNGIWSWTVDRSASIGKLFGMIKQQAVVFPCLQECATYLEEFSCVLAEHDDSLRMIKYTHPLNLPDDAMHATTFALLLGIRLFNSRM